MFFDAHGNIANSQSIVVDGLTTGQSLPSLSFCLPGPSLADRLALMRFTNPKIGVQSGSDIVNSEVKRIIRRKLESTSREARAVVGDLAAYMRDFEREKRNVNYEDGQGKRMLLRGKDSSLAFEVALEPQEIRRAFKTAFDPGLCVVRETTERVLEFDTDFAVLFCGGSMGNPGLQDIIKKEMGKLQGKAAMTGTKVHYAFLGDKDRLWSVPTWRWKGWDQHSTDIEQVFCGFGGGCTGRHSDAIPV